MKSKYLYATLGILALTTPAMGKLVVTVLPGKPYIDAAYEQKAECGVKISLLERAEAHHRRYKGRERVHREEERKSE